jgi:membrane fusion protein
VLAARKDRLHGDISLAVPFSWQLIGYLLFGALAVAVGFLGLATYSRVETVAGAIVVDKGVAPIVPTRAGVIAELAVRDGQHVRAGDLLARIRSEEDLASGATAPERILESLDLQVSVAVKARAGGRGPAPRRAHLPHRVLRRLAQIRAMRCKKLIKMRPFPV